MKVLSATLSLLVILLLVALVYQYRQTTELQSAFVALGKDRDAVNGEIRALNKRIAELQKRPISTSGNAAAPRTGRSDTTESTPSAAPVEPKERPGVTVKAPAGWARNGSKPGSYVVGVDSLQTWGGMPSAYVQSLEPTVDGFGGMMQTTSAENFTGKRVRLSGWIKTEDANQGGGHLWLRVDGEERGQMLQFDNMGNRAVKGTTDWQEGSIVLDVPAGAAALAYGFFVQGGGKMWVSGTRIEEVGPEVPSTNMLPARKTLPKTPTNLGFYPESPK